MIQHETLQDESESTFDVLLPDEEILLPEAVEKVHYVDNDEMLAAYKVYKYHRQECIDAGKPEPVVPRYLAECLLKICHRTAYKWNFINYSFRDEMISDAIENCVRGINSFDHVNGKYIFSYYTTTAWNAFVRRIQKEALQSAIKGKLITELDTDSLVRQEHDNGEYQTDFIEYMKQAADYREAHEKKGETSLKIKPVSEHENALVFDEE